MFKIVLISDVLGVYLGNCFGLGFWSKLDAAGQTHACVFDDPIEAMAHAASWDQQISDVRTHKVECADAEYATAAECERAGLHNWLADA